MNRFISLDVAEWAALCQSGACLPVKITLAGSSMQPLIRKDKDAVTIVWPYRQFKLGDVVLFARSDGSYVVHRLYKMYDGTVQTLGDGCINPDAPMPLTAILGLVTTTERGNFVLRLDTATARFFGRIWMRLVPLRQLVNKVKWRVRRIFRHG